jgi:hypothetical protein
VSSACTEASCGHCGRCDDVDEGGPCGLSEFADPACYGCQGTGLIKGFGRANGSTCKCVAICEACNEPFAWARDDARAPRTCDGCTVEE